MGFFRLVRLIKISYYKSRNFYYRLGLKRPFVKTVNYSLLTLKFFFFIFEHNFNISFKKKGERFSIFRKQYFIYCIELVL